MTKIAAAVGSGKTNNRSDVRTIEVLLNRNLGLLVPYAPLDVDGKFASKLEDMIKEFQSRVMRMSSPDGVCDPNGQLLPALSNHAAAYVPNVDDTQISWNPGGLTEEQYVDTALRLDCEAAAVKAVVGVELGVTNPLDSQGRPTILFERHRFHALTAGRFDKSDPDISNPVAGGYGRFSEQYPKLERAKILDKDAALESASWGAFQIMGENFSVAGFASVDDFVAAMNTVAGQIGAFVTFVNNSSAIHRALQKKDWTAFAKNYNGPDFAKNSYDTKMKNNYNTFLTATN